MKFICFKKARTDHDGFLAVGGTDDLILKDVPFAIYQRVSTEPREGHSNGPK